MDLKNFIITNGKVAGLRDEQISEIFALANSELPGNVPQEKWKEKVMTWINNRAKANKEQSTKPHIANMKNIKTLKSSKNNKVKVFVCGGGNTVPKEFCDDAYSVGVTLAGLNAAYGQGGLTERDTVMGETYWGYKENGGKSANLFVRDVFKEDIETEYDSVEGAYVVDSITDLIKAQYLWSDVVVIMPGGTGTLMEILGYMEQNLDYKEMPKIILYNKKIGEKGFFDSFKSQIEFMTKEHFISRDVLSSFEEVDNIEDLKKAITLEVNKIKELKSRDEETL